MAKREAARGGKGHAVGFCSDTNVNSMTACVQNPSSEEAHKMIKKKQINRNAYSTSTQGCNVFVPFCRDFFNHMKAMETDKNMTKTK